MSECRRLSMVIMLAAAALLFGAGFPGSDDRTSAFPARSEAAPTLADLIGQKLIVRMQGTAPSASLLARARLGRIGGVIVHRNNIGSRAGLRSITSRMQQAAAAGGQPPLLIAVDQEGGPVKTVSWIPPTRSPRQMGRLGSERTALAQGRRTGAALRSLGINTDLAPVVDVPAARESFLYRQGRTWSFRAGTTATLAGRFAVGLGDGGALATAKHFPGLGLAALNTDHVVVRLHAKESALGPGLLPYRTAIAERVPLIMLSNAVYTAYDRNNAGGWSRAIGTRLLRNELGFRGVTVTDSLDGAAHARHVGAATLAIRAANAGTDLLLLTGSEPSSRAVYWSLLRARPGTMRRSRLLASYHRILALKRRL
jgi:beta-N-acetylhexosaminidase